MLEKWTKTSSPASREMKPKPFSALKNFTVPVATNVSLWCLVGPCDRTDREPYSVSRRATRFDARVVASGLLVAVRDAAAVEVVCGDLDLHAVARKDADAVLAHLAAQVSQHLVAIVERDPEVAPLEGFLRASLEHESVFFGLRQIHRSFCRERLMLGRSCLWAPIERSGICEMLAVQPSCSVGRTSISLMATWRGRVTM